MMNGIKKIEVRKESVGKAVQKIFIEKGYYILETFGDRCGDMYFKAVKFENTKGCCKTPFLFGGLMYGIIL